MDLRSSVLVTVLCPSRWRSPQHWILIDHAPPMRVHDLRETCLSLAEGRSVLHHWLETVSVESIFDSRRKRFSQGIEGAALWTSVMSVPSLEECREFLSNPCEQVKSLFLSFVPFRTLSVFEITRYKHLWYSYYTQSKITGEHDFPCFHPGHPSSRLRKHD